MKLPGRPLKWSPDLPRWAWVLVGICWLGAMVNLFASGAIFSYLALPWLFVILALFVYLFVVNFTNPRWWLFVGAYVIFLSIVCAIGTLAQ